MFDPEVGDRRAKLTPAAVTRASCLLRGAGGCGGCWLWRRLRGSGASFSSGQIDQGDLPRAERLAQHGAQGAALGATELLATSGEVQPLPKLGPWKDDLDRLLAHERRQAGARASDADPGLRGAARPRLRGRLRCGAPLCPELAARAVRIAGRCLCAAELRAGRGLPVRLEPRDRPDQRHAR